MGSILEKPTIVYIQMYIEGMSSFRAQTMDFQVDIYFQEKWVDSRLAHNGTRRILLKVEAKNLIMIKIQNKVARLISEFMDPHLFKLIWHPDIYFANARTSEFHDVTQPNFLVWIYPNGTIWYDCRISLTVLCMQNLARYPLDSQRCALRILSYAYDTEQIVIRWNGPNPIEINTEIRMPDMRLRTIQHNIRNDTYATGSTSHCRIYKKQDVAAFSFIVLTACVATWEPEVISTACGSYVPTALIVVISWFSFWLDVEAVPGRVSLSITTLLTLATQSSAARMALPQASYVKAIDVWMGACMAFAFSAMIEFTSKNGTAYETFSYKYGTGSNIENKWLQESNQSAFLIRRNVPSTAKQKLIDHRVNQVDENRKYAQMIDRRSRVLFPMVFVLFNFFYWFYYIKYAVDTIE
ncbi:Neurotransmitter-gated ion-channel ligand binding domain protein [Dictyocaulus viviparus]|uniref:Neurotransmitter-gated ion-channel ligand binding domain protein n=1 Tax=Dictyocaulus viviparus TaxID=29172 RepID=A0A0D8XX21_DICVI|nr:Neurotransmitter-gated ion-channel ligand binding domain protein [Dictyocaulus viviparus]